MSDDQPLIVHVERPDEAPIRCTFEPLAPADVDARLRKLACPESAVFDVRRGARADAVSFQPCPAHPSQDRHVMRELVVCGQVWTFTGVFDGHLGDATVEHTAYHLPIIVAEHLEKHLSRRLSPSTVLDPEVVRQILTIAVTSFDEAIAGDVLDLFPGGLDTIASRSDDEIRRVINDFDGTGENYKKARLCLYGTTALVALVDPAHENMWVAGLGDCEAVLVAPASNGSWTCEPVTNLHNGQNPSEVARVRREHPNEPEAVLHERVLGTIAPFRCIGDTPFKMPVEFTRRILYNLYPGVSDPTPWEIFLSRNRTPPYISSVPEVVHRRLAHTAPGNRRPFLILATDGLAELYADMDEDMTRADLAARWAASVGTAWGVGGQMPQENLALRLLRDALGGDDTVQMSQMLTLDMSDPWMDDTTIVVQVL
ncbi:protein serine/threonine phosphatase 2C [Vararia minispora EC-137]|uniref:Protein serine/threonine phosphatase 2C n=1 Tax=Vararia minispora EC-137 TaxID=1314806 RepID=A0ACB8QSW3_9AGAM|nr:protein serine/threonine phosphatase 2C [Vararia minispora EC-137]